MTLLRIVNSERVGSEWQLMVAAPPVTLLLAGRSRSNVMLGLFWAGPKKVYLTLLARCWG